MLNGFYTDVSRKMNSLLYRGYDDDGRKIYNTYKFRPQMFLESKDPNAKWKTLDDVPVDPMRFDSMSDCRAFMKQYEDIKSFKIFGNSNHIPAFIQAEFPNEIKYKAKQIDICYLDIETQIAKSGVFVEATEATETITLIGIKSSKSSNYIQWGLKPFDQNKSIVSHIEVEYHQFDSEHEMLSDFILWWNDPMNTPDVITGWNTKLYDIPYLVNRLSRILGSDEAKRLSPWNNIEQKSVIIKGKECTYFNISGIQQLDYIDLFKKFCLNTYGAQESYKLDFIADLVLGEGKINYGESGYSNLTELYEKNHTLYADYNIVDIELIIKLEEKLGLLALVFTLAYYAGTNYNDALGTVAIWDAIIFRYLAKKHIAIPQNKMSFKTEYAGGFVKDAQSGRHEWIVTYDLNSLYPMLIVQYNISPETIVPHMKVQGLTPEKILDNPNINQWYPEDNLAIAANGACFRKDKQGFLPALMEELYNKRVTIKQLMITAQKEKEVTDKKSNRYAELLIEIDRASNEQMGIKILLNSCYGALANIWCRYYNIELAEAITLSGQLAVQTAERELNKFLSLALEDTTAKDRIIMSDTDSVTGDTIISINNKNITIEDYYNSSIGLMIKNDSFNRNYVKDISKNNDYTISLNKKTKQIETKKVQYVMKHTVKKRMFKITDDTGNTVVVTKDHSIIVENIIDGKILEITPEELNSQKHKILSLKLPFV